jgi:hypothetical protein
MHRMSWRRLGARVAAAVTAAAVISMSAFAVVAIGGGGRDSGNSGGLEAFNACITHTRFLVLVRYGHGNSVVATIKDRVRGAVVGEVTAGRTTSTLGGAAAGNGRYVMSTATPLGRDATAIERCWDRFFPIAPDS